MQNNFQARKKPKHLYMAVTNDVLELPVFFADSAKELAKASGVAASTVLTYICRGRNEEYYRKKDGPGRLTKTKLKYIKVELPENEEEDLMADVPIQTIITI